MKYCPVCLKEYLNDATHCEADGQALEQSGVGSAKVESPGRKTLAELIHQQAPLPIEPAVNLACAICEVVEQATGKTPDFFDPRHIPLTKDSQVDRAAFLVELQRQAAATDTLNLDDVAAYLSPEAAQQQQTDATSAVYSLGVILYEMLTGQLPFAAASVAAIVIKQILESPRSPRELRDEISESLQRVMLRALETDKNSRPASPTQFRQELQAALRQETSKFETFVDMPAVAMPPPMQAVTEALDEMVGSASPQPSDEEFDAATRTLSESPAAPKVMPPAPSAYPPSPPPPPQIASPPSQAFAPQAYGSYSAPVAYPQAAS
ncbi:MAG: protein kinase domain-containing protein, partial [Burkholderiales bacterium]